MGRMDQSQSPEAFAERIFQSVLAGMDVLSIYIGDRLGLYRALAERDALTSTELALMAGCHPRYVREWLEQQAVTGLLTFEDNTDDNSRRYSLPHAAREVLTDADSLNYISPVVRLLVSMTRPLPQLIAAFRDGGGSLAKLRRGRPGRAS